VQAADVLHRARHFGVAGTEAPLLDVERPAQMRLGFLVEAEREVRGADRRPQLLLHLRTARQPLDPGGGVGEHLRDGHVAPALGRRGGAQHVAQEGVDLFGTIPFGLGAPRLPEGGHHARDQSGHEQRDGDGGGAVPAHELPEPVAGGRRLSQDGEAGAIAAQILTELLDR
jgi:hypothetical protein